VQFLFNGFAVFAGGFLDAADQLFLLALGVGQVVIGELGPFLFELALGDVPVAFDFECVHNGFVFCWFSSAAGMAAKYSRARAVAVPGHQRSSRTTTMMTRRRPTEPPPMMMALPNMGDNRSSIVLFSFVLGWLRAGGDRRRHGLKSLPVFFVAVVVRRIGLVAVIARLAFPGLRRRG